MRAILFRVRPATDLPRPRASPTRRATALSPAIATATPTTATPSAPPAGTLQARLTMHALPVYLGLVGTLADRHPALRRKVLRLLERLLRLESEDASDALSMVALKQMLLDCVLMLLCRGCELSALAFLKVGRTRTRTHTRTRTQTRTRTRTRTRTPNPDP